MGALPLSKRAKADSKDVKDRLDKLSAKVTEAAEKVHISPLLASQAYLPRWRFFLLFLKSYERLLYSYIESEALSNFIFRAAPGNTGLDQSGERVRREAVQ